MSQLDAQTSVACPLAQAAPRLIAFFRKHGNDEGDVARLTLEINVTAPGLPLPLTLARSVVATIQAASRPADMTPRFRVQWAPEPPGPFPLFAGELYVGGSDDYESFRLRLSGSYTPPYGLLGEGFDVVLGNHIAQLTASDLLRSIKRSVERAFEDDEARKQSAESRVSTVHDAPPNG